MNKRYHRRVDIYLKSGRELLLWVELPIAQQIALIDILPGGTKRTSSDIADRVVTIDHTKGRFQAPQWAIEGINVECIEHDDESQLLFVDEDDRRRRGLQARQGAGRGRAPLKT